MSNEEQAGEHDDVTDDGLPSEDDIKVLRDAADALDAGTRRNAQGLEAVMERVAERCYAAGKALAKEILERVKARAQTIDDVRVLAALGEAAIYDAALPSAPPAPPKPRLGED